MEPKIGTMHQCNLSQAQSIQKTKLKLEKKLVIKEGMTVNYVKEHGNKAQRAAAEVFDNDTPGNWGDGKYSQKEADTFNRCIFKLEKDKLTVYDPKMQKNGNRGMTEIPLLYKNEAFGHYRDDSIYSNGVTVRKPKYFDKISGMNEDNHLVQNVYADAISTSGGSTTVKNGKINTISAWHCGSYKLINTTNKLNGPVKAYVQADNFATEKENLNSVKYDKNSKVIFVKPEDY